VGQTDLQVRIRPEDGGAVKTDRFWIWTSYDNLKIAALQAVACAQELNKIRPKGKVQ
jgi:aspartate-semialdehyde dehydrogenase